MASYIRTSDHLTIVFDDGVSATVYLSNVHYHNIVQCLREKDYELARELSLPTVAIKKQINTKIGDNNIVSIDNGIVSFNGREMHNTLTSRMLSMLEDGFDIEPMKLFLINLQQNPSYRAVTELYDFLEKGNLPITDDGCFLAYKQVRSNFTDIYTGKMDNSVGTVVEMPRNEVNEDSNQTCSHGLHFCSRDYINVMGPGITVILKINPRDVVAIPKDYNDTKGRACRVEIISVLNENEKLEGSYRDLHPEADEYPTDDNELNEHDDDDDDDDDDDEDEMYEYPYPTDDNELNEHDHDDYWDEIFYDHSRQSSDVVELQSTASAFAGIPVDEEPIVKAPAADDFKQQVVAISTASNVIMKFKSLEEAAENTMTSKSDIRRVLNGGRKSANGWVWKWADQPFTSSFVDNNIQDLPSSTAHQENGTIYGGKPHGTKTS
jgi:hypothetical protein